MSVWQDLQMISEKLAPLVQREQWDEVQDLLWLREELLRTACLSLPGLSREQLQIRLEENQALQRSLQEKQSLIANDLNHLQQFKKLASEYEKHTLI